MTDTYELHLEALGAFIRSQRQLANLSLRQLADVTKLSNPYLSQLERGLHEPSLRVLRLIADALGLSLGVLLTKLGMPAPAETAASVESAVRADPRLAEQQKAALIAVYRSMVFS